MKNGRTRRPDKIRGEGNTKSISKREKGKKTTGDKKKKQAARKKKKEEDHQNDRGASPLPPLVSSHRREAGSR